MADRLKEWARSLKSEVHAVYLAARDPRTILAADCPKVAANQIMDLCGVINPDRIGK
jgi:hypothetical protein